MGKLKALYQEYGEEYLTKTLRMKVMRPIFSREIIRENIPAYIPTAKFSNPQNIFEMFRDLIDETREEFICLHLDSKNRINCINRVSTGSLIQTLVHPREVFKSAGLSSAASVVFVHNHPSGDPAPSGEDISITKRLKECGVLLGIPVLDHVIIGDGVYVSLAEAGYI